jgi:hypothetical protein
VTRSSRPWPRQSLGKTCWPYQSNQSTQVGGRGGGRISILLNFQDSFNRQKRMFNTMHLVHKDEGCNDTLDQEATYFSHKKEASSLTKSDQSTSSKSEPGRSTSGRSELGRSHMACQSQVG